MIRSKNVLDVLIASAGSAFLPGDGSGITAEDLAVGQLGIVSVNSVGAYGPGALVDGSITANNGDRFCLVEATANGLVKTAMFAKGDVLSVSKKDGAAASEQVDVVDLSATTPVEGERISLALEFKHDKELFALRQNTQFIDYTPKAGDTVDDVGAGLAAAINGSEYISQGVSASYNAGTKELTITGVALPFKGGRSSADLKYRKVIFSINTEYKGATVSSTPGSPGQGTYEQVSAIRYASNVQPANRVHHPFEEGNFSVNAGDAPFDIYTIAFYASSGPKNAGIEITNSVSPAQIVVAVPNGNAALNNTAFQDALLATTGYSFA